MKSIALLVCMLAVMVVTGCNTDLEVTPTLRQTNIEGRTITAFRANIAGTEYYVDDLFYTCVDNVLYVRATTSPYDPAATCDPNLVSFTTIQETVIPLFSG